MNRSRPFIGIIIILLLFIVLHNVIVVGLANVFTFLRYDNRESLEVEAYKLKVITLEQELAEYEKAYENLRLYDGRSYVLSKIALRDVYHFYDFLMISTDTKVKEGDAVINESGLVGLVDKPNKTTARVNLLTGKVKVSVKIGDVYGMLDDYNEEDKLLIVHNVSNYKNVPIGSEVFTSGLQKLDGGIRIGEVIKTETIGVEQIVYVKPYVEFDNLNYLMVIAK